MYRLLGIRFRKNKPGDKTMKIFYCKLCNKSFARKGFREHLKKEHRVMSDLTKSNLWKSQEI